ncbi:MAG: pyrroline-5-carboxylate reductase family protein [Solirubrobacteraceae bacterium]
MRVGLIGAGNMARAMARGWGDPVLVSDSGSGRARALADELGGEALSSNLELAKRADVVVLCHKPYQLHSVAREISEVATVVVSVLGGTLHGELWQAYRGSQVFVMMPNIPVEVRQGVIIYAEPPRGGPVALDPELEAKLLALFARLGRVVRLPERLLGVAAAITSVGPAYQALLAEAQVDAGVRHGLRAQLAGELVAATMSGSAALLEHRGHDTLAVRREVTSPAGSTARGLDALERAGVRTAFQDATDAVLGKDEVSS